MVRYVLMGIAVIMIVAAISFLYEYIKDKRKNSSRTKKNKTEKDTTSFIVDCPLCGTHLAKGNTIFTKVWRPMNVPEQRIIVSGCPSCFPKCEPGIVRTCPRCHKQVPQNGHLVAHLFNMPMNKKHMTITGCTECCKYEKIQKN